MSSVAGTKWSEVLHTPRCDFACLAHEHCAHFSSFGGAPATASSCFTRLGEVVLSSTKQQATVTPIFRTVICLRSSEAETLPFDELLPENEL